MSIYDTNQVDRLMLIVIMYVSIIYLNLCPAYFECLYLLLDLRQTMASLLFKLRHNIPYKYSDLSLPITKTLLVVSIVNLISMHFSVVAD